MRRIEFEPFERAVRGEVLDIAPVQADIQQLRLAEIAQMDSHLPPPPAFLKRLPGPD